MSAKEARAAADESLVQFRLVGPGQGAGHGAVGRSWRSGSWWPEPSCTGRRCSSSTSPPRDSTRRAASPCGRSSAGSTTERPDHLPHHPLHGGGRRALRPSGHHGPRPHPGARHPRRTEGFGGRGQHRDRHRHRRSGRPCPALWKRVEGPTRTQPHGRHRPTARFKGATGVLPQVVMTAADVRRLHRDRPLGGRAHPGDGLHQPDRKGAARLMATRDSDQPTC